MVNGIKSDWAPVVSGVPQGTVLGPLLFSLYINDISADIESEIRLFADDCVFYREIKNEEDTLKLQRDIDRLGSWARKWGMRFQPVKCNMMQLTNKRSSKIQANYTLEGTVLENVEGIKYLGVTITNNLKWNTHISNVCTKANRTLGFLRRNLYCNEQPRRATETPSVEKHAHPPGVVYCAIYLTLTQFTKSRVLKFAYFQGRLSPLHYFPLREDSTRVLAWGLHG